MQNHTQAPSKTNNIINESLDLASFSATSIDDLDALFTAIRDASDKNSIPFQLAGIGISLSNDWCEHAYTSKENLQRKVSELSRKEGELK
ncbi:MAG: hypothetical protein KUG82_18900 [Pseudomonadales bacterium]|nr:hypothetical protein [Pseudomonadales bacterium]